MAIKISPNIFYYVFSSLSILYLVNAYVYARNKRRKKLAIGIAIFASMILLFAGVTFWLIPDARRFIPKPIFYISLFLFIWVCGLLERRKGLTIGIPLLILGILLFGLAASLPIQSVYENLFMLLMMFAVFILLAALGIVIVYGIKCRTSSSKGKKAKGK